MCQQHFSHHPPDHNFMPSDDGLTSFLNTYNVWHSYSCSQKEREISKLYKFIIYFVIFPLFGFPSCEDLKERQFQNSFCFVLYPIDILTLHWIWQRVSSKNLKKFLYIIFFKFLKKNYLCFMNAQCMNIKIFQYFLFQLYHITRFPPHHR